MTKLTEMYVALSVLLSEKEEGQGLVEYGLILALIAVVCIGAVTTLGTGAAGKMGEVAAAL